MIPLGAADLPADAEQLRQSLLRGACAMVLPGKGTPQVVVAGHRDGSIDRLALDLTGCHLSDAALQRSAAQQATGRTVSVGELSVRGEPFFAQGASARFVLLAHDVRLALFSGAAGGGRLVPQSVGGGEVRGSIGNADLEQLLLVSANRAAQERGIAIREVTLELTSLAGRTIGVRLSARARKVVSAMLHLEARLEIDEQLDAVLSGVRLSLGGFLRLALGGVVERIGERLEGRRIPLAAIDLAGARLRDLAVDVSDGIALQARIA